MKVLPCLNPNEVREVDEYYILSRRGMLGSWRVVMSSPNQDSALFVATRLQMMSDSRDLGINYGITGKVNCELR